MLFKKSEHYTSPTQYLFLSVYPSTNTCSRSTENLTISTESTTVSPSPATFVSKDHFDTSLQYIVLQMKVLLSITLQLGKLTQLGEKQL